jgi:hypothetical protein
LDLNQSNSFLWELRASHYHNYIIRSVPDGTWIVTNYRKPSLTKLKKGGSTWKMISYPMGVIVIFSESYQVYLGSDANGNVNVSKSVQTNEEWYIIQYDDNTLRLISKEHERYLSCSPSLSTVADMDIITQSDACKWFLDPVLPTKHSTKQIIAGTTAGVTTLGLAIVDPISTLAGLGFVGMTMEAFQGAKTTADYTINRTTGKMSAEETTVSELSSKEDPVMAYIQRKSHGISSNSTDFSIVTDLFFLSTSKTVDNSYVGCNSSGRIFATKEPKGWSVWNFQVVENGKFRIMSWAQEKYLCLSTGFGGTAKITNTKEVNDSTIWKVEESPSKYNGVTIKPTSNSGIYLKYEGDNVRITYSFDGPSCVWNVEGANRQNFFLYSHFFKIRIGVQNNAAFTTNGMDKNLVWRVEQDDNGLISFYCGATDRYLGSNEVGQVTVSSILGDNEKWKIHIGEDGSAEIESNFYRNKYLSCNQVGESYTDDRIGENSVWKLEPALPQKSENNETFMKYAAGAAVAGLSIMNPLMAFGAFSAVGMTTRAVDDGEMTAVFSGGNSASDIDTITNIAGDLKFDVNSLNKSLSNRPFCEWRSWK